MEQSTQTLNKATVPGIEVSQSFSENTSLAKKLLIVVILLSILVIGPVKLSNLHDEALDVFKNGTETLYTVSVYNDIRTAADAANQIAGLTGSEELKQLAEQILKTDDPSELVDLFSELKLLSEDVYTAYEKTQPSDLQTVKNLVAQIRSAYTTVGNDVYWKYADHFNSERSGFPASLLALLGGADKLPDKAD